MIPFSPGLLRMGIARTRGNRLVYMTADMSEIDRGSGFSLQYLNGNDLSDGLVGYLSMLDLRRVAGEVPWLIFFFLSSRRRLSFRLLSQQ